MKTVIHYALSISAAAALLAACGGSQPPIAAPAAMPHSAQSASHAASGRSQPWIGAPGATASLTREPLDRVGYKKLYVFKGPVSGPAPAYPYAGLTEVHGVLYGTTSAGGAKRAGTVFRITPSGNETLLYNFDNGAQPLADMISVSGVLYGTTSIGGALSGQHYGTVFRITTAGSERAVYGFKGPPDGAYPAAPLIHVGGKFYGTTASGGTGSCGSEGCGSVFEVDRSGNEQLLYSFQGGSDGSTPEAGLAYANGVLYGTTTSGGASNAGTVFKLDLSGNEKVLYSFQGGSDGYDPQAGLTYVNGMFYGTTSRGGPYYYGTAFSMSTTGKKGVVHAFGAGCYSSHCTDGALPYADLRDVNGKLYGTTEYGGRDDEGTVFEITLPHKERVLYNFIGNPDGAAPHADLTDVNGKLFGTTQNGGGLNYCVTYGCGTVFRISP
jgi:uncharacterized repeat protein (TIGR03803 family)